MEHESGMFKFASLVRIPLALAVALLLSHAGVSHPLTAGPDQTVSIQKSVEALHVDFCSKVNVPSAPEKFTLHSFLLPDSLVVGIRFSPRFPVRSVRFPGSVIRNAFYASIRINAP
ncbi:MAG: hypothetical protein H7Z75_11505 [Ferruginibacter sp.]|nr:hypothetical protein [Cytophagales bacterium]